MNLKTVGVIPARYASARFPGKPLAIIHGKTMIERVYEQASKSDLGKIVVATDDERIREVVLSFGGDVVMTDPNHASGTDRCAEVVRALNAPFDVVVNIQGDEPMIDPENINGLLQLFARPEVQIGTMVTPMKQSDMQDSNTIKAVLSKTGKAIYFSRSPIPYDRNGGARFQPWRHLGVYAFRAGILQEIVQLPQSSLEKAESLEQLRWMENDYSIYTIEVEDNGVSVDSPEDLEYLLSVWKDHR